MQLVIKPKALRALERIAGHIDSINTLGAGSRWLERFFVRVSAYALPNVTYPICKHHKLAARNYRCISYRNWVIAFKTSKDQFIIYEVIQGSVLY